MSSSEYTEPLHWITVVPTTSPEAPTMASHGLVSFVESASTLRDPFFSSRVKQSCKLRNRVSFASLRFALVKNRMISIDGTLISGWRIRLNRFMKRVTAARGMRLVSRKLRSSCMATV